jgi:hypothetical protein
MISPGTTPFGSAGPSDPCPPRTGNGTAGAGAAGGAGGGIVSPTLEWSPIPARNGNLCNCGCAGSSQSPLPPGNGINGVEDCYLTC